MLKLMIVDDEAVIRTGIRTCLNWESMKIDVVGEAGNGRDALNRALLLVPDIVITDIKMPIINGIEFSRRLLEKRPATKIVFLTGYSDYEYMKQAIRLGIKDYLLKPVHVPDLEKMIQKLCMEIMQEQSDMRRGNAEKQLLTAKLPILRGDCLSRFMANQLSEINFFKEANKLGLELSQGPFVAIALEIDEYRRVLSQKGYDYEPRFVVQNVAEKILSEIGVAKFGYLFSEGDLLGIMNLGNTNIEDVAECCRQIQFFIYRNFFFTITVAIGAKALSPGELKSSCSAACETLERKVYAGKNQILYFDDELKNIERTAILLKKEDEDDIREALSMRNGLKVQKILDGIFLKYLGQISYSGRSVQQFGMLLLMLALQMLSEENMSKEAIGDTSVLLDELNQNETVEEMRIFIKNFYYRAMQVLNTQDSGQYSKIVRDGIRYMKENFAKAIQIRDVAEAVHVTPNYFSKVFKQETGENFTEQLNKYRIEKAKELITQQGEIKIYEIAEMVGFRDYKYFTFIFKKYTGYTPFIYRQLNI